MVVHVYFLFWPLLGIVIGLAAAQRRGFPLWQGVIGGALLGILSPIMFFLSDPSTKRCHFCLSSMPRAASVCARCAREQPANAEATGPATGPSSFSLLRVFAVLLTIGGLAVAALLAWGAYGARQERKAEQAAKEARERERLSAKLEETPRKTRCCGR